MRNSTDDTPEQPENEEDGQATDTAADRAQPELTEQNLVSEQLSKEKNPERRDDLEGELEEMTEDIQDANSE